MKKMKIIITEAQLKKIIGKVLEEKQNKKSPEVSEEPQPEKAEPKQRDIADLYLESNVLWASAVREASISSM